MFFAESAWKSRERLGVRRCTAAFEAGQPPGRCDASSGNFGTRTPCAASATKAAELPFHYPQIRQPDLEPSDVAELADDRKGASPNLRESAKSADSSSSSSRERIRKGSRGGAELVEGRWRGAIARTRSIPRESEKEESADFADGRRFFVSSPWQPHSRSRLNMRLEKMWVMEREDCRTPRRSRAEVRRIREAIQSA